MLLSEKTNNKGKQLKVHLRDMSQKTEMQF